MGLNQVQSGGFANETHTPEAFWESGAKKHDQDRGLGVQK